MAPHGSCLRRARPPHRRGRPPRVAGLAALLLACASCDDPRLDRAERFLNAERVELEAIASDRARFAADRERLLAYLAEARRELAEAGRPEVIAAAAAKAGLVLDAAVGGDRHDGGDVREGGHGRGARPPLVHLSWAGSAEDLLAAMDHLALPRGARLAGLRCTTRGCGVAVAGPAPILPSPVRRAPRLPPERPWWPPSARRWDQLRAQAAAVEQLKASLGDVADIRGLRDELDRSLDVLAQEDDAGRLIACARAASAAGARLLELKRVEGGIELVAPGAGPALETALRAGWELEREGSRYLLWRGPRLPPARR